METRWHKHQATGIYTQVEVGTELDKVLVKSSDYVEVDGPDQDQDQKSNEVKADGKTEPGNPDNQGEKANKRPGRS